MSQYTIPNLTVVTPNGRSYASRRYRKDAGIPIVFLQCFRGNLVSLKAYNGHQKRHHLAASRNSHAHIAITKLLPF